MWELLPSDKCSGVESRIFLPAGVNSYSAAPGLAEQAAASGATPSCFVSVRLNKHKTRGAKWRLLHPQPVEGGGLSEARGFPVASPVTTCLRPSAPPEGVASPNHVSPGRVSRSPPVQTHLSRRPRDSLHVAGEASWWKAIETDTESVTRGDGIVYCENVIIEVNSEQLRPVLPLKDAHMYEKRKDA